LTSAWWPFCFTRLQVDPGKYCREYFFGDSLALFGLLDCPGSANGVARQNLGQFMGVGVLAMIILFQPEIRKFLLVIGRSAEINRDNIFKTINNLRHGFHDDFDVHQLIESVKSLKATRTGALVVFSRDSELKFYCETGDYLDADVNKRLILSIFRRAVRFTMVLLLSTKAALWQPDVFCR